MAGQGRDGIVCRSPIECNHRDTEQMLMIEEGVPQTMLIDPSKARFPCCIVWTPLPVLSWFIPFIGHMGICREDGVILDFAGPNFVCTDNFAFGTVARYIQINKEKCEEGARYDRDELGGVEMTWDNALRKSTQEFQHRSYNLLTCNCHSFVANALNRLHFQASQWNVVNLAALILLKGRWVSRGLAARSFLPFFIVLILGLTFGGWTFVGFLTGFCFLIVGWFLLGTYCFKSLIQL